MLKSRVKIKVCGMTQAAQVRAAVDLGVDAIGMILHANSPREISLEAAAQIRQVVPAFVTLVGVFVNCPSAKIERYVADIGLDLVQLHGEESSDFGASLSAPYIKALRAQSRQQLLTEMAPHTKARAILIDPYVQGVHGGTGRQLDLSLWPKSDHKLILAGGLSAVNVAQAVTSVQPYAVDLNSGLETSPGIKDLSLLEQALMALGR